jgi:hypothetical protein
MSGKKFEWGREVVQAGSDIAEMAQEAGIPGIGLVARFAQSFYERQLQKRFGKFVTEAEVDQSLIEKILTDETHSNCFYAVLETVRQTHSKIGLSALALIYRDHWNDESYLIGAMQSFSQISDKVIEAYIDLYEAIPVDQDYLVLKVQKDGEGHFHDLYNEAVELIRRNFFIMSTGAGMHANGPVQGMKWTHSDTYYNYCKAAKALV